MLALSRGLLAGLLILGLVVLGAVPGGLSAQDKKDTKDPKKDPPVVKKDDKKKDDSGEKKVGFATSDGLTLNGYWYQGVGVDKQRPDAVMMFPAPGNKVTDAWIDLARRKLSEKNFSVLLFDWRGCGMNGLDVGSRVFESTEYFWNELYNQQLLKSSKATIEDKGLDYKGKLQNASSNLYRYRDFMLNDLMGARFFLDRQNDNGKCNTNRVWIISEKDGAQLGLAFIAFEFNRNSIYNPKITSWRESIQTQPAGKNYAGLVALSYAGGNATANAVYKNSMATGNAREANNHLQTRLATVLLYTSKEKDTASKNLVNLLGASGTEDHMKKNFKYLRPIDVKDKPISGISMIDTTDSFEVMKTVQTAMVEISKVQNFGKDATDREANKMTVVPRFPAEIMGRR